MSSDFERIELGAGDLRFSALAKGSGPTVLCVHGFPDHAASMAPQLEAFAAAGFRAVAPTLRGYEERSQPADNDYRIGALAADIVAWVDALGEDRVHLIGHDWGAIIGFVAAARAPERFHSFTSLAIPHLGHFRSALTAVPRQLLRSWYIQFFQVPALPERLLAARDAAFLDWIWRSWSPRFELPEAERRALHATFARPGVRQASIAYYRQNLQPTTFIGLAPPMLTPRDRIDVPTLVVHGAEDGCIDARVFDVAMKPELFGREWTLKRVEGAGHWVHLEHPEAVNALAVDWFGRHGGQETKA